MRALPGETVIEHQHVVGSALPFPHQPGSGLQLGARRRVGPSGLLELLCKLAELALRLRAQAAQGDFLQPVCDSSYQQLAAEVRRCLHFVETTPLLTKFADVESGEVRERLSAGGSSWIPRLMPAPRQRCDRPGRAPLGPKQG